MNQAISILHRNIVTHQRLYQSLLVVCIISLAIFVRFWRIEYIPNATDGDEMAYLFAGQSLIEFGVPISWSAFEQPTKDWMRLPMESSVVNENMSFPLIKPWLDHSFLVPMIAGGWSEIGGFHFGTIPPALWYRLPMLVFALMTLTLSYLIAKEVFGYWPALVSLILLCFSPTIIFIQRMVVSENLIIPFFLLALYLYIKKQPILFIIIASALAALAKPTGLSIVLLIGIDLTIKRQWKMLCIYVVSTVLLFGAVYSLYISSISPTDMFTSLLTQSHRLIGWSNPAFLFSQPGFQNRLVLDFSYYLILILGFWIFVRTQNDQEKLLSLATLVLLVTIWASGAEQDMLGWYKIPLFVLLTINAAKLVKEKNYTVIIILTALTMIANVGMVRYPINPLPQAMLLRSVIGLFLLASAWLLYHPQAKKVLIVSLVAVLGLYGAQSFYIIHTYFGAACRDRTCPTPTITFTQLVKTKLRN